MKEILLKKIVMINPFTKKEEKNEDGSLLYFNYRQQLWNLLRSTNDQKGMTTDEAMNRARLLFILEGAEDNKPIFLEEVQYQTVKKCIDEIKWLVASVHVLDMVEMIRNAKEVEVKKK